ncbi:Zinc finger, RING/FYVE/PHD-type [Ascosphaera apis ARSEF 7405]|uniref:Pre-mRNA-splicing factor CWC24 n=1 Tax=Ascosphaera apis ARSEF 7405 TaxID=392613 RepID=A0A167V1Y4_9EURO|nr:Zinc finger, RING/FYVE/PHD-type [Ascosphaera apis ARSEF 7405]
MADPDTAADSPATPVISFKKRTAKKSFRKKPAAPSPPPAAASPSSESDDDASDDDYDSDGHGHGDAGERRHFKRRRKTATVTASSTGREVNRHDTEELMRAAAAPSIATVKSAHLNEATKTAEWFDEPGALGKDDLSAQNLLGKTRSTAAAATAPDGTPVLPDGTYRGANAYSSFIQKNPDRQSTSAKKFGPTKTPSNVRTITITDFAPDVCKDYKLTGFCGFGDNCKFLHAREDYKQGWELDRDWEINTSGGGKKPSSVTIASAADKRRGAGLKEDGDGNSSDDEAELEDIPFACIICKKPYTNPIVTKCGHYFCEACALKRYRKSPNCAACGSGTGGVFNTAKKLEQLLKRKRERAQRRRERALEAGEEPSDDDDDDDDDDEVDE